MDTINTNYQFVPTQLPPKKNDKKVGSKKSTLRADSQKGFDELINEQITAQPIETPPENEVELSQLLKAIGQQGKNFKQSRTIEDLELYKKKIKQFLTKVLEEATTIEARAIYNTKRKEKVNKLHLAVIDIRVTSFDKNFMEEQEIFL